MHAQDVRRHRLRQGRATRRFPPDARSVRDARSFTRERLGDDGVDRDTSDRAVMIVSELAGNAVSHAGSAYTVDLERDAHRVRGEVSDDSRHLPVINRARARACGPGGRGLVIVDSTADRWGATLDDGRGKIVWFEIDLQG